MQYKCISICFLIILQVVCGQNFTGESFSNPDGQELTLSFLQTAAFRKIVTSIVQDGKNADTQCKIGNRFSYMSYTGRCENCSLHCSNPTDGMIAQCLNKCEDYMINQALSKKLEDVDFRIQVVQDELNDVNTEVKELEQYLHNLVVGFNIVAAVMFVIFIFAGCRFYGYIKHSFVRRQHAGVNVAGDVILRLKKRNFKSNGEDLGYGGSMPQTPILQTYK